MALIQLPPQKDWNVNQGYVRQSISIISLLYEVLASAKEQGLKRTLIFLQNLNRW